MYSRMYSVSINSMDGYSCGSQNLVLSLQCLGDHTAGVLGVGQVRVGSFWGWGKPSNLGLPLAKQALQPFRPPPQLEAHPLKLSSG